MKKLAIVALALVIAMTFVGCGSANDDLLNTVWQQVWGAKGGYSVLSFLEDGVVTYQDFEIGVFNTPKTGEWVAAGNTVTIKDLVSALNGTWTVEREEDALTLTNVDTGKVEEYTLYLDANN